jgi:hypothetical protein
MARGHIEPRALVSHAECFWAKSAESLENNGVEFFAMQKSAQESEKKGDSSKNRLSVGKFEGWGMRSRMGVVGASPGSFHKGKCRT